MDILDTNIFRRYKEYQCMYEKCNNKDCKCVAKEYLELLSSTDNKDIIKEILFNISETGEQITLEKSDIVQFSSFDNCTRKLCEHILYNGNRGYTFFEIGEFLVGTEKKKAALVKYGENHSKTSELLGLTTIDRLKRPYRVYLTKLGENLLDFRGQEYEKCISNLILRIKLIQYIYHKARDRKVSLVKELDFLKTSTLMRRLTNIKTILNYVYNRSETNLDYIYRDVEFK